MLYDGFNKIGHTLNIFLQWKNVPKESTEFKITADLDVNTFKSTETP